MKKSEDCLWHHDIVLFSSWREQVRFYNGIILGISKLLVGMIWKSGGTLEGH